MGLGEVAEAGRSGRWEFDPDADPDDPGACEVEVSCVGVIVLLCEWLLLFLR